MKNLDLTDSDLLLKPSTGLDDPESLDDFDDDDDDSGFDDFNDASDYGGAEGQVAIEKHNDLLKELTSFSPYLKTTVNNWLGITWSDKYKKYLPNENISPIMNIKGVTWCIGRIGTYTRKNNILTHIEYKDYCAIMTDFIKEIWLNIMTRKKEFGLISNGDVLRVCNELQHAAELVLMGAGGGKYSKFLGSTTNYNVNEQVVPRQPLPVTTKSNRVKRLFFGGN